LEELSAIELNSELYFPPDPRFRIVRIHPNWSKFLPLDYGGSIRVSFEVAIGDQNFTSACIFRTGDVRIGALMSQIISKFSQIFEDSNLNVRIRPYRVFATDDQHGIVECIPSGHRVADNDNLQEYFESKYGGIQSKEFGKALLNFVKSEAAYTVLKYICNAKLKELVIDDAGYAVYRDFDYVFEMKMEEFRILSKVKEFVMPVKKDFLKLFIQSFIVARGRYLEIETIIRNAGLTIITSNTLKNLRERFLIRTSDSELIPSIETIFTNALFE
jgi:phosphatidylinositol 4-kinase